MVSYDMNIYGSWIWWTLWGFNRACLGSCGFARTLAVRQRIGLCYVIPSFYLMAKWNIVQTLSSSFTARHSLSSWEEWGLCSHTVCDERSKSAPSSHPSSFPPSGGCRALCKSLNLPSVRGSFFVVSIPPPSSSAFCRYPPYLWKETHNGKKRPQFLTLRTFRDFIAIRTIRQITCTLATGVALARW